MSSASPCSKWQSGIRPLGRAASGSCKNAVRLASVYFSATGPSGTEPGSAFSGEWHATQPTEW